MSRLRLAGLILAALLGAGRAVAEQPGSASVPILAYHRFDPATPGPTTVTVRAFEAQLVTLAQQGFRVVPLAQALERLDGRDSDHVAAITVDDGHRSVYTVLFPIIRARHLPVTLFVYPSAISNASYALTWEQLREMQDSGLVDVESHTYWHPDFNVERRRRTPADFRAFVAMQLGRSRQVIESRLGRPVAMLAWPFGIVTPELEAQAHDAGYTAAFGYGGGPARAGDDPLALPRIPVSDALRGAHFAAALAAKERRP